MGLLVGVIGQQTTPTAEPAKCCFDKEWTAVVGEVGMVYNDDTHSGRTIDGNSLVGYDFYRKRQGSLTWLREANGTRTQVYDLRDFSTGIHYRREGNNTCTHEPLRRGVMYPPCIPADAKYVANPMFGYGQSAMKTNVWEFTRQGPNQQGGARVRIGVTQQGCVPVVEIFMGKFNGTARELNVFFTGYHPGIGDIHRLDVPADCVAHDAPVSNNLVG